MPRPRIPRNGEPATYANRIIPYSPFVSAVPRSYVPISDPWGYLRVFIQRQAMRKPAMRKLCEDADYFLNLAAEYYQAAGVVQSQTKALLYYYGYLNLMKAYLSLTGVTLGTTHEHHGLTLDGSARVRVLARSQSRFNVFPEFVYRMNRSGIQEQSISVRRILSFVPEIHEIGVASGVFRGRHFVRINVTLWQSKPDRRVWYVVAFNKSERAMIRRLFGRFYSGRRRHLVWQIKPDKEHVRFESRRAFRYKRSTREVYGKIRDEVNSMPVFSLLTISGYRHYISLRSWPLGQFGASIMAMFWLGSLVRYRPRVIRRIMDSPYAPVLSEFLAINPVQFLYQMTNFITASECVKPYSHL